MVVCPIAIVAGCAKCPIVKACPLKTSLGDYKPEPPPSAAKRPASKSK
jgi:hypothetical protein